ncbi:hypothetical protein ACQPZX_42765 [Actinoplanes sp. CA-142083]|uniref:hypothetical protein n=1 Tax=Actinoplanes sp. CA-142083 TaxID=3239903 RepID=UPI003D8A3011
MPPAGPDRGVTDSVVTVDATELSGAERQQLAAILRRAAAAPSIDPPVADQLTRAAAAASLLVPAELRNEDMRRRLDAALDERGNPRRTSHIRRSEP